MRVLSIDLDYIMYPDIDLYQRDHFDYSAVNRWRNLKEFDKMLRPDQFAIDQSNLMFCFNNFLRAIKTCKSVRFGYEHDSILHGLEGKKNIQLINIDHHVDFASYRHSGSSVLESIRKDYELMAHGQSCDEGSWVGYLSANKRLKEYHWVRNPNSTLYDDIDFAHSKTRFSYSFKDEHFFSDWEFDHVFVCLSPQYVPQIYWHYFSMFISAYEEMSGEEAQIDPQYDRFGMREMTKATKKESKLGKKKK